MPRHSATVYVGQEVEECVVCGLAVVDVAAASRRTGCPMRSLPRRTCEITVTEG